MQGGISRDIRPAVKDDAWMTSVFQPVGEGGDWKSSGIFDKFHESDLTISLGFADAAWTLVARWVDQRQPKDGHLLPIIWLYRHALELVLKHNIREAADCLVDRGETDGRLDREALDEWLRRKAGHKLASLASRLDELLTMLKLENLPSETHDVLQELHALDPGGDAFRYATVWSPAHGRTVSAPRPAATLVDVAEMGKKFEEAFRLLAGGVASVLMEYGDLVRELKSQYESDASSYFGDTFDERW